MPRTKRDYAERLAEIEQREAAAKVKIDAIRAEKRRLQNREREKERKARTKRLIEIGAVMEHVLGHPIEHGDLPALQEAIEQLEHAEKSPKWLSRKIWKDEEMPRSCGAFLMFFSFLSAVHDTTTVDLFRLRAAAYVFKLAGACPPLLSQCFRAAPHA